MYNQTPAIYNELYGFSNFYDFIRSLRCTDRLKVKEYDISGKKTILITRDKNNFDAQSNLHDECSIVIINEDRLVIAKSINKIYRYGNPLGRFVKIDDNKPTFVEEYIPGVLIALSKVNNVYLISTKLDIHGKNYFPGTRTSVGKIFLEEINNDLLLGIDELFNSDKTSNGHTWSFILNKEKFNNYKLYLVDCVETEYGTNASPELLNILANKLCLKRPKGIFITGEDSLYNGIDYIRNNSNFDYRKVILTNHNNIRAFFNTKFEGGLINVKKGISKKLEEMIEIILINKKRGKNNNSNITTIFNEEKKLFEFINKSINELIYQSKELYKNADINNKSRKQFANRISKSSMSKALFAFKDGKITNFDEIIKVMSKKDILRIIDKNYKNDFRKCIKEFKNRNGN